MSDGKAAERHLVLAELAEQIARMENPRSAAGRRPGVTVSGAAAAAAVGTDSQPADANPQGPAPDAAKMRARANDICLRQLTAAARTRQQLLEAMARKHIPLQIATETVERLIEVGLVDDAAYAIMFVQSDQARRGLSKHGLRQQLQRRGIGAADIESALADIDADSQYQAAVELIRKRAPAALARGADVARRRLLGLLQRRGYGPGLAGRAVSTVLAELSDDHRIDASGGDEIDG